MPIAGTRQTAKVGNNYRKSNLYEYAKTFKKVAEQILNEDGVDLFESPRQALRKVGSRNIMKTFCLENAFDLTNPTYDPIDIEDIKESTEALFENDMEALMEHTAPADIAPLIGMSAPIHKLIMMNCAFASTDGIQKVTAVQNAFPITMERRFLVMPDGTEIDIAQEQNKLTDAMNSTNPVKDIELTLPVTETVDIIGTYFGGSSLDNLDVSTKICAVLISGVQIDKGDPLPNDEGYITRGCEIATETKTVDLWMPVDVRFTPNYGRSGHFDRTATQAYTIKYKDAANGGALTEAHIVLTATMNKNRFLINNIGDPKVQKIKLRAKLDSSSAMLETCHTEWTTDTDYVEIGSGTPLSVTVSPNEMKDIAAMYNENQLTKHMSMFSDVMIQYKNDMIKWNLDDSYDKLDERNGFFDTFDFAPPKEYALTALEYRSKMFMDFMNRLAGRMLQVLNDPNFTLTVFGDPLIIDAISPQKYDYKAPGALGAVTLNYTQTIANVNNKKVFNFIGADNLRNTNELIIVLKPHNSERITYRIYDYQLFVSNEVGNITNPVLPGIYAFERWAFYEFQPVQGRVKIMHPTGLRED